MLICHGMFGIGGLISPLLVYKYLRTYCFDLCSRDTRILFAEIAIIRRKSVDSGVKKWSFGLNDCIIIDKSLGTLTIFQQTFEKCKNLKCKVYIPFMRAFLNLCGYGVRIWELDTFLRCHGENRYKTGGNKRQLFVLAGYDNIQICSRMFAFQCN